jgi:hypothetical protein
MINSKLKLLIGMAVTHVLFGCAAVSQPVYKACTENDIKEEKCKKVDGVPYVLPRTALKVTFPVTEKTEKYGKFVSDAIDIFAKEKDCTWDKNEKSKSPCSEKSFKEEFNKDAACINHVFKQANKIGVEIAYNDTVDPSKNYPKTSYKLGEVSVVSTAEPDPDQIYFVEVKGGLFETRNLDISFSPGGILNEISASAENKSVEVAAKTFGSILGAAAKVAAFAGVNIESDTKYITDYVDCNGDTKKSIPESKYKNLVFRVIDSLRFIEEFPSKRMEELRGANNTAHATKDNLELRLKELDASYAAALTVFELNNKTETKTYEIMLMPKINDSTVPLAIFSKSCGLYRTVPLSEKMPSSNVPLSDNDLCKSTDAANVAEFTKPPHLTGMALSARIIDTLNDNSKLRGIYYRVPETARLTIKNGTKDLIVKDIAIAQFGKIASLPAETGSSNVTYKVTLDPVTGMLLKVTIASTAVSTDTAKNFIDPVGDYLKARKDSQDELTQLQKEESLLKVKKSIKELKEAL